MRSGIAPKIAENFPASKSADDATKRGDMSKLGNFSVGKDELHDVLVYNIYGQFGWKREHVNYGTVTKQLFLGIRKMRDDLVEKFTVSGEDSVVKVGFPRIGSGLGGGDWEFIRPMIEEVFQDRPGIIFNIDFVEFQG